MKLELLHLNHDSSWLLTYTPSDRARPPFNLVIDPWLAGAQYDIHPSFSRQIHTFKPHISSLSELEIILANRTPPQLIDAILISHPFTDHCHLQTLQTLSPTYQAPIFVGTEKTRAVLKDTRFEHHCHVIPLFKKGAATDFLQIRLSDLITHPRTDDGSQEGAHAFPDDLHMMYIPTSNRLDMTGIHLHGSIVIAVGGCSDSPLAQSIIYSPHGMPSRSYKGFLQQYQDRLHVLALMQSFQRSTNPWFLVRSPTPDPVI